MIWGQKDVENGRHISNPRAIILLNGESVQFINWTVTLNSNHMADTFTITLPFNLTSENLDADYLVQTTTNVSELFTNPNVLVEVWVGYPSNVNSYTTSDLSRIMYGYMDTAELDFSNQTTKGETVVLTGRNMAAPLIDNKSTIKYQNMTSSAIAEMMAKMFNLNAVVKPTYTLVGTYFQTDTTAVSKDVSYWDFLDFLASQEGYEFRVFDNTLYFGPWEDIIGNVLTDGLNYAWGQNIRDFQLSKSPHAAKDIVVEVHSFSKVAVTHVSGVATKTTPASVVLPSSNSSSLYSKALTIWNAFAGLGWPANAIAAIMGNWQQESSLNVNEPGGLLAQWGGSRYSELFTYCSENNLDPYSAEGQCSYAYWEIRSGQWISFSTLCSMSPTEGALYISNNYEKPAAWAANNAGRMQYAQNWYNTFANSPSVSKISSTPTTTSATTTYTTTSNQNVSASAEYSNGSSSSMTNQYLMRYFYPGLTQEQCQAKAEQILKQLSMTELDGTMRVTGNEKLTVDRLLNISGITGLSGNYYVRQATHTWDLTSDGYRCDVTFSNLLLQDDYSGGL